MRSHRILRPLGLLCFLCLVLGSYAQAQDDPAFQVAAQPFSSYQGGNIDAVDLSSGNLSIDIPLMSYPQRGGKLGLSFVLHYQSGPATESYYCDDTGDCWTESTAYDHGWNVIQENTPVVNGFATGNCNSNYCAYQADVETPDGGVHQLIPVSTNNTTGATGWRTVDGSGFVEGLSQGQETVIDSQGTTYLGFGSNYALDPSHLAINVILGMNSNDPWFPLQIQDSNGNQITASAPSGSWITGWTDSLGRSIPAPATDTPSASDPYPCPTLSGGQPAVTSSYLWSLPSLPGGPNNGTYPIKFCIVRVSENPFNEGLGTAYELQSMVLPNGTYWSFDYDTSTQYTGNLMQVNFPIGGSLSYSWEHGPRICNFYSCTGSIVASRTLNPNDGTSSGTWQYSYNLNPMQTTVTDAAGNDSVHTFSDLDNPYGDSSYYETNVAYFTGTGGSRSQLKTIATNYRYSTPFDNPMPNNVTAPLYGYAIGVLPSSVTTTLNDTGQSSSVTYGYDSFNFYYPEYVLQSDGTYTYEGGSTPWTGTLGRQTTTSEQDYGGALLRTTNTSYQFQSNATYLNANLLDLPSSVQITGAGPGSYTTFGYDESGSPQCACGNQTSVHGWLNTTGGYLTTSSVYNSNGLVTSVTDPKSNPPTTYQYGSGYAGSGPTSITNALGQTTSYTYDFNKGLVTSVKDPNGQNTGLTTIYQYDDMLRATEIDYPDGGQTIYGYPSATEVQISEKIDTTGRYKTWNLFVDGLGRLSQTQLTSDPDGTDYTLTTYDGMGRKYQVYNPTRCSAITTNCGESTWGYTTYRYDALSRPTSVAEQDGSAISTSYSGNSTTVTDEAGKTRESFVDGLGRLVTVTENPGGLNYSTSYTYDALNNLAGVTQVGSRQRNFTYDSFSRLTIATNPESGTTCYGTVSGGTCQQNGYDANGNLVTTTDARGIVTTSSYDSLNRITQKTYSDGTPTANFQYDATADWGATLTNTTGRLTESWTSGTPFSASVYSYDAMGRVTTRLECTPYTCGWGGWGTAATYDLSGNLTSYTNGQGTTLSQSFDSAGHLSALTSNLVDGTHPGTLWTADTSQGYYADGDLKKATFGNGLTDAILEESRLQPCRIDLDSTNTLLGTCDDSLPSGNIQHFHYTFGGWGTTNNGDVTNWVASGAQNFNRSYSYDGANRLSTMSAPGDTCSGLSWNYDAWGNRYAQNAAGGTCNTFSQTPDGSNHFGSPYQYDAAGNMTYDGVHSYTYDAENRLTRVDGGSTASYSYDTDGNRTEKTAGGVSMEYIYDVSGRAVAEDNGTSWTLGYVYAGGQLVAQYDSNTTRFMYQDHLGSVRLVTDPNGNLVDSLDFLPFGEQIAGTQPWPHKFTGYERDAESDLDNAQARYYGSSLGRFISPDAGNAGADPANPQSWNMYSYVLNNPINAIDPTGKECIWDDGSYDSANDPDSGSYDKCTGLGGTWISDDIFENSIYYRGDWTSDPDGSTSALVSNIQGCQAAVSGGTGANLLIADSFASGFSGNQTAYVLATANWESGPNFIGQNMTELGGPSYFSKYDGILGNNNPGDGFTYRGRGYVQITGKSNYQNWSNELSVNLVGQPSLAATPDIAAEIAVEGMDKGSFRGHLSLYDFVNPRTTDYFDARGVINGDKNYTRPGASVSNGAAIASKAASYANTLGGCQ